MLTAGRKVSGSSSAPPGHLLSAVHFNSVKSSNYTYYLLKYYETQQFAKLYLHVLYGSHNTDRTFP